MNKPAKKSIPFYVEKWDYLTSRKQGHICPIAYEKSNILAPVTDLHHAGIHNIKWVRDKYYLVVHSLLNLIPVSNHFHLKYGSYGKRSEMEIEKWQKFLENPIHWKCKVFVNEVRKPLLSEKKKYTQE